MGIQGLLQVLKSIQERKHISEYHGQRVAIDAFCWLHKGAYSCALELGKGMPTKKYAGYPDPRLRYIDYCMKRLNTVINAGVQPVLVFDGGRLPMKRDVEEARGKSRHQHREEADALWKEGKTATAIKKYAEGISITGDMAFELIKALRARKVEYVVAPYEADAEMTYLYKERYVSLVMTEDSDLLAFGCDRVLFKFDNEGYGFEIDTKNLGRVKELDFSYFTKDMFLKMCILNGCDYLPSIRGIGLKKAHNLIKQTSDVREIVRILSTKGKCDVPPSYVKDFERAFLTFKFQTVYDLKKKCMTSLSAIEGTEYVEILEYSDRSFLGP